MTQNQIRQIQILKKRRQHFRSLTRSFAEAKASSASDGELRVVFGCSGGSDSIFLIESFMNDLFKPFETRQFNEFLPKLYI